MRLKQHHHQDYINCIYIYIYTHIHTEPRLWPMSTLCLCQSPLSLSMLVYAFLHNSPLPLQLVQLYLGGNFLKGTLPELWSECRSVSLYLDTVSDQRKPLTLHSEALKLCCKCNWLMYKTWSKIVDEDVTKVMEQLNHCRPLA